VVDLSTDRIADVADLGAFCPATPTDACGTLEDGVALVSRQTLILGRLTAAVHCRSAPRRASATERNFSIRRFRPSAAGLASIRKFRSALDMERASDCEE
jgi:hypothetical protein